MSIDHGNLAGYELFPFDFDWSNNPSFELDVSAVKKLIAFEGTSETLTIISDSLPYSLDITIPIWTKEDEKTLFDFFDNHKGRWKKFWVKSPISSFRQYSDVFLGQSHIDVYPNDMEQWYSGVERIFLDDGAGNSLTRKIVSIERLPPGSATPSYPPKPLTYSYLRLNFDAPLIDDWLLSTTKTIGILRLVRFDKDDLVMTYSTDMTSEISLSLKELVYEYSEV